MNESVEAAYGESLAVCMNLLERRGFYGVAAESAFADFTPRLGLTPQSRVLELGSGVGGPALYFASAFGAHVVGVDLSPVNCALAREAARAAGLEARVEFLCADAREARLETAAFTHVFASEALCCFPDKPRVLAQARDWLVPGGRIAFLEAACERPVTLRTADHLGPVKYESLADYERLLSQAGFVEVQRCDTTALAMADVSAGAWKLLQRREAVIAAAGEEIYYGLLEIWAEFMAAFAQGALTHCGFIATKA